MVSRRRALELMGLTGGAALLGRLPPVPDESGHSPRAVRTTAAPGAHLSVQADRSAGDVRLDCHHIVCRRALDCCAQRHRDGEFVVVRAERRRLAPIVQRRERLRHRGKRPVARVDREVRPHLAHVRAADAHVAPAMRLEQVPVNDLRAAGLEHNVRAPAVGGVADHPGQVLRAHVHRCDPAYRPARSSFSCSRSETITRLQPPARAASAVRIPMLPQPVTVPGRPRENGPQAHAGTRPGAGGVAPQRVAHQGA